MDIMKHTLNTLSVQNGEKILDVGCGKGPLTYELALQTGDFGKVCGIDQNSKMLRHAIKRCENLRNTEFFEANADDLPFPEESFDAACCTEVLLYIKDVAKVISEIKRVLKPTGRILVMETDWRGVVLHSDYDSITRKIFSAWGSAVPNPNLAVRLSPLLLNNGFCNIDVKPIPILNTEYNPSQISFGSHGMMNWINRKALKSGVITKEQSQKWLDDLDVKGESGNYFFCVNRFLFLGQMA